MVKDEAVRYSGLKKGLTGPAAEAAVLSDGGIMSGVRVDGGSMPLVAFCWIRYMARENCSRVSLPVCLVSASPLRRGGETRTQRRDTAFCMRNNTHCPLIGMSSDRLASGTTNHFCMLPCTMFWRRRND